MTKIQSWAMASVGAVALAAGVLLATGALTSAQTPTPSTPTATPAASAPVTPSEDATHEASGSGEISGQFAPTIALGEGVVEVQVSTAQVVSGQFAPGGKLTPIPSGEGVIVSGEGVIVLESTGQATPSQ